MYKFKKKHVRKDGTVTIGPNRQYKWVKGETKQRKYRPRGQAKTLWSKRFGYLDIYTYNQRKLLICPSGYTFGQGMCKLNRLWYGYKMSLKEAKIEKMEHYARVIQETQEDMGLKTTSFPHLGIYGDVLVFRDYKTGQYGEEIDHSELKEKQNMEEAKEKFAEIAPLIERELVELKPDIEKGEQLITIPDEIPQPKYRYRVKHGNRMHYSKKREEEWVCEECGETVTPNKNHICETNSNFVTFADTIPFREN